MEKLRGHESLSVVYKRFSDGCEVVHCMLEFYKEMAEVEHNYAARILKLLGSSNYTFHSNILMQWLGSDPFEEIGTVKHSWQNMGNELVKLASLHAEKAESFADSVRKPLQDILPKLEKERKNLYQQKLSIEQKFKYAEKKYEKAKANYNRAGNNLQQVKSKNIAKVLELEKEFKTNEDSYKSAHHELVQVNTSINQEIAEILSNIQVYELQRVNTISQSLQEFAKTLSNTAPAYLEGMQRIVLSVNEIDGTKDISNFVSDNVQLQSEFCVPSIEFHPCSSKNTASPRVETIEEKDEIFKRNDSTAVTTVTVSPSTANVVSTAPSVIPKVTADVDSNVTVPIASKSSVVSPPTVVSVSSTSGSPPLPPVVMTPSEASASHSTVRVNTKSSSGRPSLKPKPDTIQPTKKTVATPTTSKKQPSTSQEALFDQLTHQVKLNDYYTMFGLPPTASLEELTKARRDLTAQLHPDHFNNDSEQQSKVQEKLVVINQAFNDVLRHSVNRELYDQLVRYREKYHRILDQEGKSLEIAKMKLSALRLSMRKAKFPISLLDELQLAIRLIEDKQDKDKTVS